MEANSPELKPKKADPWASEVFNLKKYFTGIRKFLLFFGFNEDYSREPGPEVVHDQHSWFRIKPKGAAREIKFLLQLCTHHRFVRIRFSNFQTLRPIFYFDFQLNLPKLQSIVFQGLST
jgi:hypothetical protein